MQQEGVVGAVTSFEELIRIRGCLREQGLRVVFTNGCFDLLHRGHVEYLKAAREFGHVLIVGVNSDASVRRQGKGQGRPIVSEEDRAIVLAALESVDYVCIFDEDTPHALISNLLPDVLVKGGDYDIDQIVGRKVVEANGGQVIAVPEISGRSTTDIVEHILTHVRTGDRL